MKKCCYCGRENEDEADRCLECGSQLPTTLRAIIERKSAVVHGEVKERTCSYCGLQNPENAERCSECGTRLRPAAVAEEKITSILFDSESGLESTDSENPWTVKDAWKCLGMFLLFHFVLSQISRLVGIAFPPVRSFYGTGGGHFVLSLVQDTVLVLNVLYFARTESWESFLKAFGLADSPTRYAWFAAAITLLIRAASHSITSTGLARGATTTSLWGFAHSSGIQAALYLAPALIAPFAEELYMRGFFYRAFRASYSVAVSTLLILGITAITHWSQFHRSWIAAASISAVTVLQCLLREKTGNLRDCIISHLVFNASGALLSLRIG